MQAAPLTAERLRAVLEFDPQTGVFVWLRDTKPKQGGRRAGSIRPPYCTDAGYRTVSVDGRVYFEHRLAWLYVYGHWPSGLIDHINRVRDDNRIANLRVTDVRGNSCNRAAPRGRSGLKGAGWNAKSGRWQAQIKAHGVTHYLGLFNTAEEAHAAYREAATRLHGKFANFEVRA